MEVNNLDSVSIANGNKKFARRHFVTLYVTAEPELCGHLCGVVSSEMPTSQSNCPLNLILLKEIKKVEYF